MKKRSKSESSPKINVAGAADSGRHASEVRVAQSHIGIAELRHVRGAEPIGPKFEVEPFREPEAFGQGRVQIEEVGTRQSVTSNVAEGRSARILKY